MNVIEQVRRSACVAGIVACIETIDELLAGFPEEEHKAILREAKAAANGDKKPKKRGKRKAKKKADVGAETAKPKRKSKAAKTTGDAASPM